ncbi:hypothetical protein OEZ85_002286 [Tetradesmus obliquus]|uniref:Uncharacterized protein n=1 Tax=Tetradesmus obliquus TaxID=3088 RepID=A0ABY8U2P2_TETOB|nr:hypothetical protein OEZ85_002286 [Tetradesmus obliquus]
MEQNLQEALENFDAATGDIAALRRLMAFSRRFVQGLRVQQLPSHLDLQLLFNAMEHSPASLAVSYGQRCVGMDYDRAAFGASLADCRCLARGLALTETLVVLELSSNGLDDDKLRMLASGLADNISVTQLNLSHNRISDRGVRALAKLLDKNSVLSLLDLADNHLHADSGRALARALGHSRALVSLNLRLNRLGDEGCAALCDALARAQVPAAARPAAAGSSAGGNSSSTSGSQQPQQQQQMAALERLNISSNGAGAGLLPSLCSMLRSNRTLAELDVSSNTFSEHVAQELLSAVSSSALLGLDVRGCALGATAEAAISEEVLGRLAKIERKRLLGA